MQFATIRSDTQSVHRNPVENLTQKSESLMFAQTLPSLSSNPLQRERYTHSERGDFFFTFLILREIKILFDSVIVRTHNLILILLCWLFDQKFLISLEPVAVFPIKIAGALHFQVKVTRCAEQNWIITDQAFSSQ